jgi:TonB family protein
MLGTLIETQPYRQRRLAGSVVSIALHTGIIGLVMVTAARGAPRRQPAPQSPPPVVYLPPTPPPTSAPPAPAPATPRPPDGAAQLPVLVVPPIRIPRTLPPISTQPIAVNPVWPDARPSAAPTRVAGDGAGSMSGPVNGAWSAATVDRAVSPRDGAPLPAYPDALRAAHVEGHVDVQFIVDTTGRAEPASIHLITASHALFAGAVRDALLRARYRPAEMRGHRVRQVVQQRFEFALRR